MNSLCAERRKLDMKFGPNGSGRLCVDLFIHYCCSHDFDINEKGFVVSIHKKKKDYGFDTTLIQTVYPHSFEGLEDARKHGLMFMKSLYCLNGNLSVVESEDFPNLSEVDYDKIYRIDLIQKINDMVFLKQNRESFCID